MAYQDYLMRQIEEAARLLGHVLFWKAENSPALLDEDGNVIPSGLLHRRLCTLLADNKVNAAENLLFEEMNANATQEYLRVALLFYTTLQQWRPERLAAADFSQEEILDGLTQLQTLCSESK